MMTIGGDSPAAATAAAAAGDYDKDVGDGG